MRKWPEADPRLVFEMMLIIAVLGVAVKHPGAPERTRYGRKETPGDSSAVTLFLAAPFSLADSDTVNPRLFGTLSALIPGAFFASTVSSPDAMLHTHFARGMIVSSFFIWSSLGF